MTILSVSVSVSISDTDFRFLLRFIQISLVRLHEILLAVGLGQCDHFCTSSHKSLLLGLGPCEHTVTYLYGLSDGEAPDLRLTELTAESGLSVSEGIGLSPWESAIYQNVQN